jgi:hypothetical protein
MSEFNDTDRESKVKQEIIKNLPIKTQQEVYDELRNDILEQVVLEIEKMQGFGKDTLDSFGIFIKGMKK